MNLKHALMVFMLTCFLISIAGVSAVDENVTEDAIIQETGLSDSELMGDEYESQSFEDLRNEIENASDGMTINLISNYYLCNGTEPIFISKNNITVDGGEYNCVIDGSSSNMSCVFNIDGDNVVLKNIKFINFNFEDSLEIIEWFGNNGEMYNCYFINNTIVGGTVVEWSGTGGLIRSCDFENNIALAGGALYIYSYGTVVRNSNFINCWATDRGGAIVVNGKNVLLEKCSFENCSSEEGGAVYIQSNNEVIDTCSFRNCSASIDGGAIYIIGDDNNITDCYLLNNSAMNGGAIYLSGSNFLLNNSLFGDNFALAYGGAMFASSNMGLSIDNCEYVNNSAYSGGALYVKNDGNVNNSRFQENFALIYGGAIYAKEGIIIENSSFNENYANAAGALSLEEDSEIIESNFTRNSALTSGGAIMTSGNLIINGSNFKDNGALDGSNNIALISDSTVTVDDKTAYDSPISLKVIELRLVQADNITYGDTFNVIVYVTFLSKPMQNGTIVNIIDGDSYSSNVIDGYATFNITKLNPGNYSGYLTYMFEGFANSTIFYQFSVFKDESQDNVVIMAHPVTFVINYAKDYSVTLNDGQGNPLSGKAVTFILNGKTIGLVTTDAKGISTIKITSAMLKNANAGTKKLTISVDNNKVIKTVDVQINKEKTKLVAKKKTFKVSKKTKRFTVTLKDSKGKAIKKAKLTLKVKGKTYKAKTNKKGKATFKITKLTKKGKFKAVIKFKASKYYKAATKKVKITVKG